MTFSRAPAIPRPRFVFFSCLSFAPPFFLLQPTKKRRPRRSLRHILHSFLKEHLSTTCHAIPEGEKRRICARHDLSSIRFFLRRIRSERRCSSLISLAFSFTWLPGRRLLSWRLYDSLFLVFERLRQV